VSRYQKGKTNLDFTVARDGEWQWHQQGHMQVCTSLQTVNHASTPPLSFFTGWVPFLPPNQQHQSTEGTIIVQKQVQNVTCREAESIQCTALHNLSLSTTTHETVTVDNSVTGVIKKKSTHNIIMPNDNSVI